jgi:hypothetical protein
MNHLTSFEVVLVIASAICSVYGIVKFIKLIMK